MSILAGNEVSKEKERSETKESTQSRMIFSFDPDLFF